jgi:alkanesulfonate monooxygenase SsuD/methylene tetrahydromethanopterin reductase-like flavin-dependent oxidoreductase (luciferase family)
MNAKPSSKKIGFLSFGAWHPGGGATLTGREALRQTVELAVAAEEIQLDGAFVRVHHFARQLSSPFPLLAAIGVSTSRIEIRRSARGRPASARHQPRIA